MTIAKNNPLLKGVSNKIGKDIVVKPYGYTTVISALPDMSLYTATKTKAKGICRGYGIKLKSFRY